jgi:hypothetical protein
MCYLGSELVKFGILDPKHLTGLLTLGEEKIMAGDLSFLGCYCLLVRRIYEALRDDFTSQLALKLLLKLADQDQPGALVDLAFVVYMHRNNFTLTLDIIPQILCLLKYHSHL